MVSIKNKNYIVAILCVVCAITLLLIWINSPEKIYSKVYNITRNDNYNEINYLKRVLERKSTNVTIMLAQMRILDYFKSKGDATTVQSIISLYQNSEDTSSRNLCISTLSCIASTESVNFIIQEVKRVHSQDDKKVLLDRLYEVYFLVGPEERTEIYHTYVEFKDIDKVKYARYVIGCLEGDKYSYEILKKLAYSNSTETVEMAATFGRVRNINLIKDNEMIMDIIKILHETGNKDIQIFTLNYME